jgi:DNA mismatch repair protein MutS
MPDRIVRQAGATLGALETQSRAGQAQVDLFAAPAMELPQAPSALEQALAQLQPDTLSPREALEALYRLKALQKDAAP